MTYATFTHPGFIANPGSFNLAIIEYHNTAGTRCYRRAFITRTAKVGDTVYISSRGTPTKGIIKTLRPAKDGMHRRLALPYNSDDAVTTVSAAPITPHKERRTMIEITHITYVNDVNIKDMSNDDIIGLLEEVDERIKFLNATKPLPKRFEAEIKKLMNQRHAFLELVDATEASDGTD